MRAALGFAALTGAPTKKAVRNVIASVAAELGNTVAVCRRCYIHPAVTQAFEQGDMALEWPRKAPRGLTRDEAAVLALLRKCVGGPGRKGVRGAPPQPPGV